MRRLGLLIIALALLLPPPVQAQEIDCDAEELRPWLENYLAWINAGEEIFASGPGEDFAPFLLVLHDLQTQMDGPGRPACADALMLETYRTFHWSEQALLCLRTGVVMQCFERMQAADEAEDLDNLIAPYVVAAGISDDERASLLPEGWDADTYRATLGLAVSAGDGASQAGDMALSAKPKGSRSNPYQPGEWAAFSEGRIRILPVDNDYQAYHDAAPGMRYIAVSIEHECYQEDEDEACSGRNAMYVSADGLVSEMADVYDDPFFYFLEGYTGAVLAGNLYYEVPTDAALGQLRLYLDGEYVFFALAPAD